MAAPSTSRATIRRFAWAGSFAAITIVGTIYGAGLKAQQEYKTERRAFVEASVEEQVAMLEARKRALLAQKAPLEEKLARLRARMADTKREREGQGEAQQQQQQQQQRTPLPHRPRQVAVDMASSTDEAAPPQPTTSTTEPQRRKGGRWPWPS